MQVEDCLNKLRTGRHPQIDADLCKCMSAESAVKWPDDPVHNDYVSYYNHLRDDLDKRPRDLTPIRTASKLYVFVGIEENIECNIEKYKLSECAMYIQSSDDAVMKNLLMTCHQISQHQAVTDFFCMGSPDVDLTVVKAPVMSKNTHSLVLVALPASYLKNILPQLFRCSDSLKRLDLLYMDLEEMELDIDELLEHMVSQHERKQFTGNLRLRILGGSRYKNKDGTEWSITDLSDEFILEWRQRCEAISTIDLNIGSASGEDIEIAIWSSERYNFYKNQPHLLPEELR